MMMVISATVLAGCSSPADRMAKCEAQGVSIDTCYAVEQNRQTSINAAAEKQALENAQAQYPVQKAQAAHVADPMREATLTGPGVNATVSNGFLMPRSMAKKRQ